MQWRCSVAMRTRSLWLLSYRRRPALRGRIRRRWFCCAFRPRPRVSEWSRYWTRPVFPIALFWTNTECSSSYQQGPLMEQSGRLLTGSGQRSRSNVEPERFSVTMIVVRLWPRTTELSPNTSRLTQIRRSLQDCGRVNGTTRIRELVRLPSKDWNHCARRKCHHPLIRNRATHSPDEPYDRAIC